MGAQPSFYKRFAPPNSYIHVDDFTGPQQLAEFLHFLDKNDNEYNKYFEWKGTGEISDVKMWCRVCALLHAPIRKKVYHNFNDWWQFDNKDVNKSICRKGSWNINT